MTTDYADFLPIAVQAVELGAKRFLSQTVEVVKSKDGDKDPVSDVDLAIEEDVRGFLADETPEVNFLGEETGGTAEGLWWCLDPIDGTANYVRGSSLCGISLALIDGDRPVVGIISLPRLDELYRASLGQGTTMNGATIRTSVVSDLSKAVVGFGDFAIGEQAGDLNEARIQVMAKLAKNALRVRMLGSAAVDLTWLAAGSLNGVITLANNPWDMAAGTLIATEAGASVLDETGREYTTTSLYVFGGNTSEVANALRTIANDTTAVPPNFDQYAAGYRAFLACLDRMGIGYVQHGLDDRQVFRYSIRADDDGNDPSEECYETHFALLDERWQVERAEAETMPNSP